MEEEKDDGDEDENAVNGGEDGKEEGEGEQQGEQAAEGVAGHKWKQGAEGGPLGAADWGWGLVAVMLGLVGAFERNTEVVGLGFGQAGKFDAELVEMQAGHFFV